MSNNLDNYIYFKDFQYLYINTKEGSQGSGFYHWEIPFSIYVTTIYNTMTVQRLPNLTAIIISVI